MNNFIQQCMVFVAYKLYIHKINTTRSREHNTGKQEKQNGCHEMNRILHM